VSFQEPTFYAQLRGTIAKEGPRIAFVEVRVGANPDGGGGTVIHTVDDLKQTPDEIMADVKEAIDSDAAHWPGMVRYQIACVSKEGDYLGGRIIVSKRGRGKEIDSDLAPEEEVSARGVTGQHMRFTESMFKTTLQNNQVMLEIMARALQESNQEKTRLMGEHWRVMQLGEQIIDRKVERDLYVKREMDKDARWSKAFDALFQFAPVLAGHMAQGTRFEEPARQLAAGSQLSLLAESFKKDPERFEKILSCFDAKEKLGMMTGDFSPILEAIERAGKVMKGEGTDEDMAVALRMKPLQELLTQEEKVVLMQLVESAKKKPEPPVPTSIEVKQVDPKVVPIDSKKKGA